MPALLQNSSKSIGSSSPPSSAFNSSISLSVKESRGIKTFGNSCLYDSTDEGHLLFKLTSMIYDPHRLANLLDDLESTETVKE